MSSALAGLAGNAVAQTTGTVSGVVRTASAVVADARAVLDVTREVRTDSAGRFRFTEVAEGRHTLRVLAVGITPYEVNLIVRARDTLAFEVLVERVVTLDSVLVEGSTVRQGFVRAYEDRKRVALGKFMDSAEVRKFGSVPQALLFIPGVRRGIARDSVYFTEKGTPCLPNIWIDNQNWGTDQGVLKTMRPDDVMAVEVHARSILIPEEFTQRGRDRGCGALVIWTRRFWPIGKARA
jgi:hypothetical protein